VVVDGGSHGLDLELVAAGAAGAGAGLIVISGTPAQARALVALTDCPIVVAATGGPLPVPQRTPGPAATDVPAIVKSAGATLVAVGADSDSALIDLVLGPADVPVMLIPAGLAGQRALDDAYAVDARERARAWRPPAVRDWRPPALGQ
jgi:hypothetical protein